MPSAYSSRFRSSPNPPTTGRFSTPLQAAISWLLLAALAAFLFPAVSAAGQGKEYVDKKNGFRLELPPGFQKAKQIRKALGESALAAFLGENQNLSFMVLRLQTPQSPEEFLIGVQQEWSKQPEYRKVSEEVVALSGFSARKVVFNSSYEGARLQYWEIFLFSRGELWFLQVMGPEAWLSQPDTPYYKEMQQLLASFEFLEPVRSRLKEGLLAQGQKIEAPTSSVGGERYYINDRVGIKILLPKDWELGSETPASFAKPASVTLARPQTLARVVLLREVLEASPELYAKSAEKAGRENTDGYQKLSEERVKRSGFEGTRVVSLAKDSGIEERYWAEIFSSGNEHFRIIAFAPQEVFDRYADTFKRMMESVEFPGLRERLPAGQEFLIGKLGAPSKPTPPAEQKEANSPPLANAAPQPTSAAPRVGGQVQPAKAIMQPPPNYPPEAKAGRIEGEVKLEAKVGKDGSVTEIKVLSGHPVLAKAAVEAVTQWRYQPGLLNGQPVEMPTEINLNFKLPPPQPGEQNPELERLKAEVVKNPGDAAARVNLANALDDSGDADAAIREYQAALRLEPNEPVTHRNLGVTLFRKGDWNGAEPELREAVHLKPDYAMARLSLAEVLEHKGDRDGAYREYKEIVRLNGENPSAHFTVDLLPVEQQDFDKASVDAKGHMVLAIVVSGYGDLDRATKEVEQAIHKDSQFALPHQILASLDEQKGKWDEAVSEARTAVRLNPNLPNAYITLGNVEKHRNNPGGAIQEYKEGIRLDPDLAKTHFNLATAYGMKGDTTEAIAELRKTLSLDPKFADAYIGLAWAFYDLQGYAAAWEQIHKARELGANPNADFLERLTRAMPEAEAEKQLKEFQELKQAAGKNTQDAQAHLKLGGEIAERGQLDEAIEQFNAALKLDPKLAAAHTRLGEIYREQKKMPEAIREWQEAIRINPQEADAHFFLGLALGGEASTRDQAVGQFRAFLSNVPHSAEKGPQIALAYTVLGDFDAKAGREKEALQEYEEGLKANSEFPLLWNEAAWLYATAKDTQLRNPGKALEYAQKAVAGRQEKDAASLDTLAEAYYVNGRFDEAIETEKKAQALEPGKQIYKDQLKKYQQAKKNASRR